MTREEFLIKWTPKGFFEPAAKSFIEDVDALIDHIEDNVWVHFMRHEL